MNEEQRPKQKAHAKAVKKVVSFLKHEKRPRYFIEYPRRRTRKKGNSLYDILALKGKKKEHWVIKVETDTEPSANITKKMEKIINDTSLDLWDYRQVALALASQKSSWPYLFEYNRQRNAGKKSWVTRKRKEAARKAAETKRKKANQRAFVIQT